MPKMLQLTVLDRPGLNDLSPEATKVLSRLVEPLHPPRDCSAIGHVVHNLARAVSELLTSASKHARSWLETSLAAASSVLTLLCVPDEAPEIVLEADTVTLWTCYLALSRTAAPAELLRLLGAMYVLLATGGKAPSNQQLELVLRACVATRGHDEAATSTATSAAMLGCGRLMTLALTQLTTEALSRRSAATCMIESKVERALRGGYRFDTPEKLHRLPTQRGLTPDDVTDALRKLRPVAERGSAGALLVAIGYWHGVLPLDMRVLPIFSPTPGLMRVDQTCSYTVIQLGGVLTELARTQLSQVLATSNELIFPWPRWMSELTRALRAVAPRSLSVADLPGMPSSANDLRHLLAGVDLPRRITPAKLVVDRAQPLLERPGLDPVLATLAALDFSRIAKVSAAYDHVREQEFLATMSLRAALPGWGELSPTPVRGRGVLSAVTPELEAVQRLAQRLLCELVDRYPGPNADPGAVFAHHAAFIHYTGFMLAAGLALRGQERTLLPATVMAVAALAGEFDKAIPGAKSAPAEMVFGAALQLQLRYLAAHYRALIDRLRKGLARYSKGFAAIAEQLERVLGGDPSLPLLVLVQADGLNAFSQLDLVEYLGEDWAGKADALRHAAPFILRSQGVDYASREALLRHAGGSRPLVSVTSAWSRGQWFDEASQLQDRLFSEIGLRPHGGLVRSLGRRA